MRKLPVFVVGVLVAGVYGWFVLKDKANVVEVKEPVTSANSWNSGGDKKPDFNNSKLSDILKKSTKPVPAPSQEAGKDLATRCREDRYRLSEMTIEEFGVAVKAGEISFDRNCLELEPKHIQFWAERFYGACSKPAVEKAPEMCQGLAFFMKAQVMYEELEDRSVNSLTDEELVNAFFANLFSEKSREIVDELALRFPESPAVAKATVAAAIQGKTTEQEIIDALNSTVENAVEKNPEDKDLLAVDMFLAVKNNEPGLVGSLNEYNANNPASGEGFYALSYHAWERGDRSSALNFINQAVTREPKNEKFLKTKANILKAKGTEGEAFQFNLGFNPQDF